MAWGFSSMQHRNSFAMQLTPNYFLGKLILEEMFQHAKSKELAFKKIYMYICKNIYCQSIYNSAVFSVRTSFLMYLLKNLYVGLHI